LVMNLPTLPERISPGCLHFSQMWPAHTLEFPTCAKVFDPGELT
jgi:hypothetical protein